MSRDKQIEEMARIICKPTANKGNCDRCGFKRSCSKFDDATDLYNAGYRKVVEQSETARECEKTVDKRFPSSVTESVTRAEVAEEIFEEIENAHEECIHIDTSTNIGYLLQTKFEHKLAELKKKYIGEDINVTTKESEDTE